MRRSRSYNVEDRDRDQHLHEPREMVSVIVGAEERGGQVEPAVNLALARSELENGKQSDSGGKNQDQKPEGALGFAAGVREKLDGEEEEHQVRRQQHQGLAGLGPIEREPGGVLSESQEKKHGDGDVQRRPDQS